MASIFSPSRPSIRLAACAATLLLISACANVPKYKYSNGRFPEWSTYEGKHFYPANGSVTAIDPSANTVTIGEGNEAKVFTITPATRIVHEGTDIPLTELPLNQKVKYIVSDDGRHLTSIWFGTRLYEAHQPPTTRR